MSLPSHVPHVDGRSPDSSNCESQLSSITGLEVNIHSILALENQIKVEEGTINVIRLKRTRNSLLNISVLIPPEILGHIFRWNVLREGSFGGLRKGSYNFLLVCHHWFQVASNTPELWTFWGNSLYQWSRRYQRSGTGFIDLVLDVTAYHTCNTDSNLFDGPLRDALRDHVASDSIRCIHLRGMDTNLLRSVLSSLTFDGEGVRCSSIESLILEHYPLNISDFLFRYHFPKLRNLRLFTRAEVSSWDHLKLRATSLTALSLEFGGSPTSPTTSHLLSILASYPNLQDLSLDDMLCRATIPHDISKESTFRVSLHRLKKLHFKGDCRRVFQLLHRLDYPDTLDNVDLGLLTWEIEEISELLGPYLQDRIRRDRGFQGRLAIHVSSDPLFNVFKIEILGESDVRTVPPGLYRPSMSFKAGLKGPLRRGAGEKLCVNIIALTPQERVVDFTGRLNRRPIRDLVATMPNKEDPRLAGSLVSDTFLQSDQHSRTKPLPSLPRL